MHNHDLDLDTCFPLPQGGLIHGSRMVQMDSTSAKEWAEMKEREPISTDWNEKNK